MHYYRAKYILDYFFARGWSMYREGNLFYYLVPKKPQKFPKGFLLEIPKDDNNVSFNNYINRLITEFPSFVFGENSSDDFKTIFSTGNFVFKCRVFDIENVNGTIGLLNYSESLESVKRMLSDAVTFVSSDKSIFGSAREQVEAYLNRCKALQTEHGSWISNFELPSYNITELFNPLNSADVNNRLIDVIEFADEQILHRDTEEPINENYVSDNSEFINYELLHSIRDIYKKSNINNIQYQLASIEKTRVVTTEHVLPKIAVFDRYLKQVKQVLLNTSEIEVTGKVKSLSSTAPLTSGDIFITFFVANRKTNMKVRLNRDEYQAAIDAHKLEKYIHIKGKVKESKTSLYMRQVEVFEVVNQTNQTI